MKRIDKIAVIGGTGTALNILYQLKDAIRNYGYPAELEGAIFDYPEKFTQGDEFKIIGSTNDIQGLIKETDLKFIFCMFRMDKMKERFDLLNSYRIPVDRIAGFTHPLAYVASDIQCGSGNIILSNSTIQSGVKLGNNNIINSNVTIEHETVLGNGNFVSANACIGAKVTVGSHCFIGLNSSIRENVRISDSVLIGMHSLVLKDIANGVAAGVPAKNLNKADES